MFVLVVKNVGFVFSFEECLGFVVISIVFYKLQCNRDALAARHTIAQGYQQFHFSLSRSETLLCFSGRGSCSTVCFACRIGMSTRAITSPEDMKVMISGCF